MHSGIDLTGLDHDVRPVDDLFLFVNGGWLKTAEIPDDRARYGSFDRLREQSEEDCRTIVEELSAAAAAAGVDGDPFADQPDPATARKIADLYASFMAQERTEAAGVAPIASFLAEVDALTSVDDLPALLGRWSRAGIPGLVQPFVTTDRRDSERYLLYLEQGGLGLPDESYYRTPENEAIRAAYVTHVERMLELAGVAEPGVAAAEVMALESALAASHWDRVATRDAVRTFTVWTGQELTDRAPGFGWAAWAQAMGAPESAMAEVVARQPSFLTAVGAAVAEQPLSRWQDWLRWQAVHAFAGYLSDPFVQESFAFYGRTLSGMPQLRDRWKRAIALVESALGEGLGQIYVARHYPPQAHARMTELVANLVEAFRQDFTDLPWMSSETRAAALAKLAAFTPKIGHPRAWRDYSALSVDAGDLVGNVCRAAAFETDRELGKLGGPVDHDEWFLTPQTVNAYYNPGLNEIVFPAAILQPPFFDVDADDAVNYGGIGAVIGHEIGHGFDDQGSRYDGSGELRDWWTAQDRAAFEERTAMLVAQFDALSPTDAPDHHVNGALTVGENIGDLGGLTISLKAYRLATAAEPAPMLDGFTGDQRFFVSWGNIWRGKSREAEAVRLLAIDPHAPASCRANIARNLSEFHEAFGVVEGDGMWLPPEARVRIF